MTDGSPLTTSLTVNAMSTMPHNDGHLTLQTNLDRPTVREGEALQLNVTVTNTADADANMPLAVIAIPGGLEPVHAQLGELKKAGRIAAYELTENTVVLYWRGLPPNGSVTLPISLTATIPGTYTAAASRSYLYYHDEAKQYTPGIKVQILPR